MSNQTDETESFTAKMLASPIVAERRLALPTFNFNAGLTRRGLLVAGGSAAALMALAACAPGGGTVTPSGKAELNFWCWANGPANTAGFNSVAKASSDLKNVTVKDPVLAESDYAVAQKLTLALSSGQTLPDIAFLNYTEVPAFAAIGALADIGSATSGASDDMYAGAKDISTYKGTSVAFPIQVNSKLFYYREDLFEQAGIDATALKTVDDFFAAGEKFHAKFPDKYIMNINTNPQLYFFGELISAYSPISFANENGEYEIESNPAFADVLGFMRRAKTSGIAYPADDFDTDWPGAIQSESICGFLGASWLAIFLPQYATAAQAGKWKAIPWPELSPLANQRFGSDAGGLVAVVPKGAPNQDAAIELLRQTRFTTEGSQKFLAATGTGQVIKSAEEAVLADAAKPAVEGSSTVLADQVAFFGDGYLQEQFASYDNARSFGYDPQAIKQWGTILQPWLNQTVSGSQSIEQILAGLQSDMQTQVGNPFA